VPRADDGPEQFDWHQARNGPQNPATGHAMATWSTLPSTDAVAHPPNQPQSTLRASRTPWRPVRPRSC